MCSVVDRNSIRHGSESEPVATIRLAAKSRRQSASHRRRPESDELAAAIHQTVDTNWWQPVGSRRRTRTAGRVPPGRALPDGCRWSPMIRLRLGFRQLSLQPTSSRNTHIPLVGPAAAQKHPATKRQPRIRLTSRQSLRNVAFLRLRAPRISMATAIHVQFLPSLSLLVLLSACCRQGEYHFTSQGGPTWCGKNG